MNTLTIGQVAKAAGLHLETIRYGGIYDGQHPKDGSVRNGRSAGSYAG